MQGRNRKVSLLIFIYLVMPVEKYSTTFSALLDMRMTYLPTFWSKKKTESRRIMYLFVGMRVILLAKYHSKCTV